MGDLEKYSDRVRKFLEILSSNKINKISVIKNTNAIAASSIIILFLKEKNFTLNFTDNIMEENTLVIDEKYISFNDFKVEGLSSIFAYSLIKEANLENKFLNLILAVNNKEDVQDLIKEAFEKNLITEKNSFGFGGISRPINNSLVMSIDPFIPGFSNNEPIVNEFLNSNSINHKHCFELNDNESEILNKAALLRNPALIELKKEKNYLITNEDSPLTDLNEFNLFLEACVFLNKPSLIIAKTFMPKAYKNRAISIVKQYRDIFLDFLDWFYLNRKSNEIIEKDSSIIIYSNKLANNKKALELVYKNFFNKQDKAIIGIFDLNDKTEILIYYKNYNSEYNIKKLTEELKESEFNIDKNFIELKINKTEKERINVIILNNLEAAKVEQIA